MNTDELIAVLATDNGIRREPVSRTLAVALAIGGAASLLIFLMAFGARTDLAAALGTWRFDLKLVVVGLALGIALWQCVRIADPAAPRRAYYSSLLVPALLAAAIGVELWASPPGTWAARLLGSNALVCLTAIPLLSMAPLAAGLVAMRSGAPSSPRAAGAAVGLLAASIAAGLYAVHCFDDSPLFVATWYSLGALPSIVVGAIAGGRLLRW